MTRLLPLLLGLLLIAACGGDLEPLADPSPTSSASETPTATPDHIELLLVLTDSTASHVTLVDPATGAIQGRTEVGPFPWGIAVAGDFAYVTTATQLVIMNVRSGEVLGSLPYQSEPGPPAGGELREGGMGIALSPNGDRAYVGVYTAAGSFLEVFHTRNGYERSVPVGQRPLEVLIDDSGQTVYTVDHDSYSVTAVDVSTWEARTIEVAPLGRGPFDKPHNAVLVEGEIMLPYQGKVLIALDPQTGLTREVPLTANTHQHGIALSPDGTTVAIVGTGPSGDATGEPSLTLLTLADGSERIIPLTRPHERVAFSFDGSQAFLTGGLLFDGGWEGVSVVTLESGAVREIVTPSRPVGIHVLGPP